MSPANASRPPHALSVADALASVEAAPEGLTEAEATRRLQHHGPNRLPEPARTSPLLRFLRHFHNVLIYVLVGLRSSPWPSVTTSMPG